LNLAFPAFSCAISLDLGKATTMELYRQRIFTNARSRGGRPFPSRPGSLSCAWKAYRQRIF